MQVGWEFDARRPGAVRIEVPSAVDVSGLVRATFIPTARSTEATVGDLIGYMPSDPASAENTLRVRERLGAVWTTIPRSAARASRSDAACADRRPAPPDRA